MAITLELPQDLESQLAAEGAHLGMALPQYAAHVLLGSRRLPETAPGTSGRSADVTPLEPAETRERRILRIRNFRSDQYRLLDDLIVTLHREGDHYVATSYDTGQYGYGLCEEDAIEHLCVVLEDYYEILQEERDNLGHQLQGHLRFLESILTRP